MNTFMQPDDRLKQLGGAWNYNARSERFIDIYGPVPPGLSLTLALCVTVVFQECIFFPVIGHFTLGRAHWHTAKDILLLCGLLSGWISPLL